MIAEGELYNDAILYEIREEGLYPGFNNENGEPYIIPEVDCETFDNMMKAYGLSWMKNRTNTADRTRLLKNKKLTTLGYTEEELGQVRFLEVEIDLDGSYSNREFLLFVIDRMICGTGGCTLYVVDEEGKTLSATSVVKLPIFTNTPGVNGEEFSGNGWKDLYVWSNGAYRKLIYSNGAYFYNASLAPPMAEENLINYPEKYRVVMDYLD
ncbi:MAG: hypothetical protein P8100_09550 [bacterium]